MTVEEALERLDAYLDGAQLGGLPVVRIIHGKGTGALRQAVRKWLSERSDVVSHRLGETWEGGTGVTVARLE
jgi:DNA mismatch repair protein MutS2